MSNNETVQMSKLQRFWLETRRIFKIAKKPTTKEYKAMVKICLIGMAIIGGLSFVVQLISSIVSPTPPSNTSTST